MAGWRETLAHLVVDVEDHFDKLKYGLHQRLGDQGPIMIQAYRGYGTPERLYLKGRVLEDKGITSPEDNDSLWENLVNMYRRFESDEIPFARIRARFQGVEREAQADEEGFFEVWLEPGSPLEADKLWQTVELELLYPRRAGDPPVKAEGQVLIPPPGVQFGVISDIDDTVLQTDATHLLHMARTVFLGNARTRLPFKGVAAFYRALMHGGSNHTTEGGVDTGEVNPLFYVSSSPWNLYDLLSDFFHFQNIPLGPILFLRDWGINEAELLSRGHRSYKLGAIRKLMAFYPHLPFILIGDSGQEDPEIYAEVVRENPKRIQAIYIRNVSRDLARPEAIRKLAKEVTVAGSTLILADDTLPMAKHAAEQGWISPTSLPEIEIEKQADEAPPSPLEKLVGPEEPVEAPTVVLATENKEGAKQAVEQGAVEDAIKEAGKEETPKPPTVVIDGDPKEEKK